MSEDTPAKDKEQSEQPRAGERLALARRDQDIALRDIAKALHLDEAKVQALEQNQFDILGAPVFAKGHLKKYAEIVGVPIEDVLTDYYQLNRAVGAPPVVGPTSKVHQEIDLSRYILPAFILLILGVVVIGWFRAGSPLPSLGSTADEDGAAIELAPPARNVPDAVSALPESRQAAPPDEPSADGDAETDLAETESPAAAQVDSQQQAQPQPEPRSVPTPRGPQVSVSMTFSGDCWTEVTDAEGSRLFFDLGRSGRTVSISGNAPLRVLFGSYANVSLTVNGESFPIPASAVRGETARFTINAR